jgi:site-specific recombinase XerD
MKEHSKALDDFIAYLRYEKMLASATITAYKKDVMAFLDFFGERPLHAIDRMVLRNWLAEMEKAGLQRSSMQRKQAAIKSFLQFQHGQGKITKRFWEQMSAPRAAKKLPLYLREEQMREIFTTGKPAGFCRHTRRRYSRASLRYGFAPAGTFAINCSPGRQGE